MQSRSGAAAAFPEKRHPWRGYFLIVAAAFCWGGAATLGKGVFEGRIFSGLPPISPLVITQTRTTVAVLLLIVFLLLRHGPGMFRISKADLLLCVLIGTLGLAGSNFLYYWAIQKTTVGVAITVQYTAPIWVLLFMVARGRQTRGPHRARFFLVARDGVEVATWQRILAVVLCLVGVALVMGLFSDIKLSRPGILAAMLAAFSFSFYNIFAQELVTRNHPLKVMSYALLSSAIVWLILNPPWRLVAQHFTAWQWVFLLVFACFSMLLPYISYFNGLKYLDPTRAVVTSSLEPVFAIVLAALFLNEGLRGLQAAGIAAVLIATIMIQDRQ